MKIVARIKEGFNKCKKAVAGAALAAAAAVTAVAIPGTSHAAAMLDLSGLSTSITTEVTAALTVVVPLAGTILAVGLGWKFVKRFIK